MNKSLETENQSVTESFLIKLRSMPDEEAALILSSRLRNLEEIWKRSFIERGIILMEVEERILWKYKENPKTKNPYSSFSAWIAGEAPQSRSDCYAALKAVKELRDLPRESLVEVPRCNINLLQGLSTHIRKQEDVLEAARNLSEEEFISKIETEYPEQHLESRRKINLKPTKSASLVIEQAISLAMNIEGCTTREEALEAIAVAYLLEHDNQREDVA